MAGTYKCTLSAKVSMFNWVLLAVYVAAPLTQLLKAGENQWTEEAGKVFEKLKNAMMTLSV